MAAAAAALARAGRAAELVALKEDSVQRAQYSAGRERGHRLGRCGGFLGLASAVATCTRRQRLCAVAIRGGDDTEDTELLPNLQRHGSDGRSDETSHVQTWPRSHKLLESNNKLTPDFNTNEYTVILEFSPDGQNMLLVKSRQRQTTVRR